MNDDVTSAGLTIGDAEDLETLTTDLNHQLQVVLDKHAPVRTVTIKGQIPLGHGIGRPRPAKKSLPNKDCV